MNKVAIVTGGASGIGLATGLEFAKNGYQVILADKEFPKEFLPGQKLHVVRCDVRFSVQVKNLFRVCKNTYNQLDVLVNCAGVHYSSHVHEEDDERFDVLTKTNIYGTMYCCREALKLMQEGVIINIASSVGIAADKDAAAYSASKAWVIHFTKCIAQEYGRRVRCNTICPGPIDTPLLRNAFHNDPVLIKAMTEMNLRGMAQPKDLAELILFMASEKCWFVNGATWQFDGGESIIYAGEPPK